MFFCDASDTACGVVIFLRVEWEEKVEISFLGAKSRLTPEKGTIPRYELLAACLGSRMSKEIMEGLDFSGIKRYYWSDSTTVLAWLSRDCQWGKFVWNRVKEIREITKEGKWQHVPGGMNPADLPSRGCTAQELLQSRWWEGPEWLLKSSEYWPNEKIETDENIVNEELKKSAIVVNNHVSVVKYFKFSEKMSSYTGLIRFFAIMIRFKNFKIRKKIYKGSRLTFKEIAETEIKLLRQLQRGMFLPEKDPKLSTMDTFLHSDGLIRIKTKIVERDDSFPFLCPIVLGGKHEIVELLIRESHENLCHAGVQTVMCYLREKFWILSMRESVKSVIRKCIICKRYNAQRLNADPSPLPVNRVKDATVFEIVGVDSAGPLYLKNQQKGWICLYTCAVCRAVHLELVTSMSTKEFLESFRRFIARRRRPNIMYSDNGKNFVGANNAFNALNWEIISKYSNAKQIDWRFNPPTAAWWGGWWERLIGMMKNILRRILGKSRLNYEEMTTVLCDSEMVLNSRPLTYMSDDVNDFNPRNVFTRTKN